MRAVLDVRSADLEGFFCESEGHHAGVRVESIGCLESEKMVNLKEMFW